MPDVWQPLREMTENLLPHLHFERIDTTNRTNIQCLWNVHAKNIQVDMDDLSSGEKAIIQLFFPLIESRVQALINKSRDADSSRDVAGPICVLMDEPELHLHPNLQGKVLDYLRRLASPPESRSNLYWQHTRRLWLNRLIATSCSCCDRQRR